MICTCVIAAIVVLLLLLYVFTDVNYFIRIAYTIGIAKYFQKRISVLDGSSIYGVCTTNDVDIFLRHMNNARYVRELDFARFDFYFRCNLYTEIIKRKGHALQVASNIRYRRTIPIFTFYKIETKVVYWDEKAVYLEQRFVTLRDGFVRAIVLSKQHIVGVSGDELIDILVGKKTPRPELPEELDHWTKSIEASSAKLRKKD